MVERCSHICGVSCDGALLSPWRIYSLVIYVIDDQIFRFIIGYLMDRNVCDTDIMCIGFCHIGLQCLRCFQGLDDPGMSRMFG